MNKKKRDVNLWWKQKNVATHPLCPNLNIFRFLKLNDFDFKKKKKILDMGFGNGENLLEFKKRGHQIFGIEIRDKLLKFFVKKNKLNKKNFYVCDFTKSLPSIKKKFHLILMIDVLCYLDSDIQKKIFKWVNNRLHKDSLFIFSFTQDDIVRKKDKKIDNWEISKRFYKKIKINFDKKNPMKFLNLNNLLKKFNYTNLKFLGSHFDVSTYSKRDSSKLRIGRYVLMKKI
tara:strand:+ start:80 stop:766 length:687 start_codon:yes stop_codon:yes gene_type:complete